MSAQFIPLDRNPPSKDVSRMDRHVSSPTIPTAPYVPLKHTEAPFPQSRSGRSCATHLNPFGGNEQAKEEGHADDGRRTEPTDTPTKEKLEDLVSAYKLGDILKAHTLSDGLRLLEGDPALSVSERGRSLDLFILQLETDPKGKSASRPLVPATSPLAVNSEPASHVDIADDANDIDQSVSDFLDQFATPPPRQRRRDDENDEEDDDDGRVKRQKLAESEMPWYDDERVNPNPSSEKTLRLLRRYGKDISAAKRYVRLASRAPTGVPASQWERIFKGECLNLDLFLSARCRVTVDVERTTRIGDAEISTGVVEPKQKVQMPSEWMSAWRVAS
ncbi:hypothetical protein CVT25_012778 [Psilocybe cyanescens]|uniref:Uncharacterized protein n=1 Tax=Psilocybe cyanescens TaxID=93625 RepID=A0A409XLH9_PSICY|nr:hypothetical protein CVT25_012778 [Psilocybe cyanescens]